MSTDHQKTTYKELPLRQDLIEASIQLAQQFSAYDTLAVIGIGGSSIGAEALWETLVGVDQRKKRLVFFDNTDFLDAQRNLQSLNLEKTAWYIVSKSGSTLETLATTEWVTEIYRQKNISFYSRCAVCTELRPNPLYNWAQVHQIPVLEIPLLVGGRFSVLSPVGLFPLAFAGVDINGLINGAKSTLEKTAEIQKTAKLCAQSFKKFNITVFWFYSSVAKPFGAWIQQLWAESLAKKTDLQGKPAPAVSTPLFAVGASDQHSILQQVSDGSRDKFVIFFRSQELENFSQVCHVKEFSHLQFLENQNYGQLIKAAAEGTIQALKTEGVELTEIYYPDHSAKSFGYLVMWFELLVAAIADEIKINAFDQPGVELSKKKTYEILNQKANRL